MLKIYLKELFIDPLYTIFICLGFVISIYCLSVGINLFNTQFRFYNDSNNFWKENFISELKFKEDTTLKDIINKLETSSFESKNLSFDTVIYMPNRIYSLQGLYNYDNIKKIYPIISGRYFTQKETSSNEKIALVGANLLDLVHTKNGVKYINLEDEEFKVVGVIGRSSESYWNIRVVVPMMSLPIKIYETKSKIFNINCSNESLSNKKYFVNFKKSLESINIEDINIKNVSQINAVSKAFEKNKPMYISLSFSILLSIISILTFSTFWANNLKRNIAIKRIVGASNIHILKILFFQILIINIIALIIATIIECNTINFLKEVFLINIEFNPINSILTSIVSIAFSVLNSLYILKNILKFDILEGLN
ncbi:ABC transporter permease [Clostridium tetani]|uniref:ABC transporter permease n=1 Tax=Clostridium tetani TaxID=1513 RepID=UPI0038B32672